MKRIATLDSIRGLALCGILTVNAPAVLGLGGEPGPNATRELLGLAVQERFFPLFSFLFGISFGIMVARAERRGTPYRAALGRRLGFLLALGGLHQLLQPGEALLPYAIVGLVLLLPATWCPTWAAGLTAVALTGAGVAFGGMALVPGLLLSGYAVARLGWATRLDASRPWVPLAVAAAAGAAATPLLMRLADAPHTMGFSKTSTVAGLLLATTYAALVTAAMASPLRRAVSGVLEPFGRMALTNYVSATLVLVAAKPFLGQLGVDGTSDGMLRMLGWCGVLLVVQWVVSRLWLARFGQGPLELVWRKVTWLQPRVFGRSFCLQPARSSEDSRQPRACG
jgi:uncharacterized membrane protein YeiB